MVPSKRYNASSAYSEESTLLQQQNQTREYASEQSHFNSNAIFQSASNTSQPGIFLGKE